MYFTNELKIYFLSLLIAIEYALDFADPSIVKDEGKMSEPWVRACSAGQVERSNPEGDTGFSLCLVKQSLKIAMFLKYVHVLP